MTLAARRQWRSYGFNRQRGVDAVETRALVRRAAMAVAVGFAALVAFQLALVAGAPLGRAAWEGTARVLPTSFRIGSSVTVLLYSLAALVVLRHAGFPVRWVSPAFAHRGTWAVVVILPLSALANFASESPWERFLMAPVAVVLAVLSFIVARNADDTVGASEQPDRLGVQHQ